MVVLTGFVMCGFVCVCVRGGFVLCRCFGNMCTCIYCVFTLFSLCVFIVCTVFSIAWIMYIYCYLVCLY